MKEKLTENDSKKSQMENKMDDIAELKRQLSVQNSKVLHLEQKVKDITVEMHTLKDHHNSSTTDNEKNKETINLREKLDQSVH